MTIQWKWQTHSWIGIQSDKKGAWRIMDGSSWYCTGGSDQENPKKKKYKKNQNGCLRPYKELWKEEKQKAKEKRKDIPFECRVPKNNNERYESLPQWSMQRNKGKQ